MKYKFAFEKTLGNIPKIIIKSIEKPLDLTIFGDLIENAVPHKEKEAITDFVKSFGDINQEDLLDLMDYYQVICDLRTKIETGKLSTLEELERIKPFYGVTFEYTFVVKNEDGSICPILFGFSEIESPFLEEIEKGHYCIYVGFSMKDCIFSILHYLLLNNYKLKRCEHCGKYFPTETLKTKYCSRNSPYKGQENNSCSLAVDHIIKTFKKRRRKRLETMYKRFPNAVPEFNKELDAVFEKSKSVATLEELDYLTSESYVKERWYKKEYL